MTSKARLVRGQPRAGIISSPKLLTMISVMASRSARRQRVRYRRINQK